MGEREREVGDCPWRTLSLSFPGERLPLLPPSMSAHRRSRIAGGEMFFQAKFCRMHYLRERQSRLLDRQHTHNIEDLT